MATDTPTRMTPEAAVARHLEWLEFALAAAREEEATRQGRLEKATDRNRQKRTVRLAEVTAEVRELSALVAGIERLQARPAAGKAPARRAAAASGGPKKASTRKRRGTTGPTPTA